MSGSKRPGKREREAFRKERELRGQSAPMPDRATLEALARRLEGGEIAVGDALIQAWDLLLPYEDGRAQFETLVLAGGFLDAAVTLVARRCPKAEGWRWSMKSGGLVVLTRPWWTDTSEHRADIFDQPAAALILAMLHAEIAREDAP